MDSMTALVSLFARAYHTAHNPDPVFRDEAAGRLLSEEEERQIRTSMARGIQYFCPGFSGGEEEALTWIVDHQLAPSVVGRSAFCEAALGRALGRGCRQYLLFAAGYDTYPCRCTRPEVQIFELDRPAVLSDKAARMARAGYPPRSVPVPCDLAQPGWTSELTGRGFDPQKPSFGSLLGLTYYLSPEEFSALLAAAGPLLTPGSDLVFDYQTREESAVTGRNKALAAAAGEEMKGKYTYSRLETLLEEQGFIVYEHLDAGEMTKQYFGLSSLEAPSGVAYVLAVKHR